MGIDPLLPDLPPPHRVLPTAAAVSSPPRPPNDNIAGTVVIRPTRASWSIDDEETR